MRSGYQDLAARGLLTYEELGVKLAALEESRTLARRELESLKDRRERLESLKQDREAVLQAYANVTVESLERLSPEERACVDRAFDAVARALEGLARHASTHAAGVVAVVVRLAPDGAGADRLRRGLSLRSAGEGAGAAAHRADQAENVLPEGAGDHDDDGRHEHHQQPVFDGACAPLA